MFEEILNILEDGKSQIQTNLADKGINASGSTSDGFKVVEYDGGVKLVYDNSGAPLKTLQAGREPGPVPEDFVSIIEQWAKDKGIAPSGDKELRKFAGAVAYGKIKPRGFGRPSPSDYGSIDETVYSPVVLETSTRLYNEIPKVIVSYLKTQM